MTENERDAQKIDYKIIHETLLRSTNPFKNSIVENPRQAIIDVESINADLTNLILKSLEKIRKKEKRTDLILIQGEPGLGKTHFLSRMRQKAKEHRFYFVDLPPLGDISRIYSHIFQHLFINLTWKDPQDRYSPLQQLVGHLLSDFLIDFYSTKQDSLQPHTQEILKALKTDYTLVFRYLKAIEKREDIREYILQRAILNLLERYPGIDQLFLEVLFKILDEEMEFLALKWLKGYDLSEIDLKRLNVRESINNEETANQVLNSLLMIIDRPILFCLDQLESFSVRFEAEDGIKVLFDTLTNMYNRYQNICILLMCQSHVWTEIEKKVEKSALDRIQIRKSLAKLSFEEGILLAESRLRLIYPPKLTLPYSTYPFPHKFIRHVLQETGYNPRRLLNRLSREFEYMQSKGGIIEPEITELEGIQEKEVEVEPVSNFLTRELEDLRAQIQKDQSRLYTFPVRQDFMKGILNELFKELCTRQQALQGITIKEIRINQKVTKKDVDILLNIAINAETFNIGIEVNNSENMTSLYHTLRRLLGEIQSTKLKYAFLLRDAALQISPTAKKTQELLQNLYDNGALIQISESDLLQLMSIKKLLEKASAGDLMRDDQIITRGDVLQFLLPEKLMSISVFIQLTRFLKQSPKFQLPSETEKPITSSVMTSPLEPRADHSQEALQPSIEETRTVSNSPTTPSDRLEELFDDVPELPSITLPISPPSPPQADSERPLSPAQGIQKTNLKGNILRILQKQHFYTLKKLKESFQNIDSMEIREVLQNMAQEQMIIVIHDHNDDFLFSLHPDYL